jgi:hypothetical protein
LIFWVLDLQGGGKGAFFSFGAIAALLHIEMAILHFVEESQVPTNKTLVESLGA